MKFLFSLSFFLYFAFAYNPYRDYVFCRYLQESKPQEALNFCLRALQKAPTPTLYVDTIRLLADSMLWASNSANLERSMGLTPKPSGYGR